MGCCSTKNTESLPMQSSIVQEFSNSKLLDGKNEINDPIMIIDKISLNKLGYALVIGNTNQFINLIEMMDASIIAMESLFEKQGLNGLDIIIEKGYNGLLQYYFPRYKTTFPQRFNNLEDSETSCSILNTRVIRKTPLHNAAERGFIEIIQYLHS